MTAAGVGGLSLVSGWLPALTGATAAGMLAVTLVGQGRRWWRRRGPLVAVSGLGAAALAALGGAGTTVGLVVWSGLAGTAVTLAVSAQFGTAWPRRATAGLAVGLTVASLGLSINRTAGYAPTVQAAWNTLTGVSVPGEITAHALADLRAAPPATGRILRVSIPAQPSGFAHRDEYLYLPPAWFRPHPPGLPVVVLLGAAYNTPTDWIQLGGAVPALEAYARTHHGLAPIVVFADSNGSFTNDTECVNGPRGAAADHLTADIPAFLTAGYGAATDPTRWAAVGYSAGGTCAIDLAVTRPDRYDHFVDIGGDLGPNDGDRASTIDSLYGGDPAAWAGFDPLSVLARSHRPGISLAAEPTYRGVDGRFYPAQPSGALGRPAATDESAIATRLCTAAKRAGIRCSVAPRAGDHTWGFAAARFAEALPALADALLTAPPAAPAVSVALGDRGTSGVGGGGRSAALGFMVPTSRSEKARPEQSSAVGDTRWSPWEGCPDRGGSPAMTQTPVGAVGELVVGLAFLCAAAVSCRRHRGRPDRRAGLAMAVDLIVGMAAIADAASATVHGPGRLLLWGVASIALTVAVVLLVRRGPSRLTPK